MNKMYNIEKVTGLGGNLIMPNLDETSWYMIKANIYLPLRSMLIDKNDYILPASSVVKVNWHVRCRLLEQLPIGDL